MVVDRIEVNVCKRIYMTVSSKGSVEKAAPGSSAREGP
jgi:hypothetical protein